MNERCDDGGDDHEGAYDRREGGADVARLQRGLRLVSDYAMPNVSDKVVRIIHSYADYVKRTTWKLY